MWRMRWFKVAAIGVGILIAFFVAMSVIGVVFKILTDLVIAAIVVGGIAVAIKVSRSRRQVSGKKAEREVREPDHPQYDRRLPRADVEPVSTPYPPPARPAPQDVDDELARLKREMGG
jgi:phosphate/sulfate permease